MDELLYYPKDVLMGKKPGIALCTLWTPKKKYNDLLHKVHLVGNLYTKYGLGILIRNVLADPTIQQIIVTGTSNPDRLHIEDDALLLKKFEPDDIGLTQDEVDEFYARTIIVDCRGIKSYQLDVLSNVIDHCDNELRDVSHLPMLIVPLPVMDTPVFPTHRSAHVIRSDSITKAHVKLLNEIRRFGSLTQPDSEGHVRQELWQLTVCLNNINMLNKIPHYSMDSIMQYSKSLWEGDEVEDLTYRYGHTMRYKFGDQIQAVLDAFKKKPETFRTVISLWEPHESMLRDDEPCLVTVHPRIRNGFLDMYAYIRTNEMYKAWPKNAAGLVYMLNRFAQELDLFRGELTITSGSAHIYDYNFAKVEEYLEGSKNVYEFCLDKKGFWILRKEHGKYIAEHYDNDKLMQELKADTKASLEYQMIPFVSSISHAFYLGRTLELLDKE